jgi:sporulation-control protein spo0M
LARLPRLPANRRPFDEEEVTMGLWDTIKGWFNIGGVKVKLQDVPSTVSKSGNEVTGKVVLTSKSDKQVLKMTYKLILEKTTGRGDDKETKEISLGQSTCEEAFEIKKDETKTFDFAIPYSIEKGLQDMGGVLGAVGKLGAFASGEKLEYYVVAECDVKGTPFDPTDKVEVQVVD